MPLPPPRSNLRERLGMYLLGFAIGLCLLGLLFMGRYQAAQRQRAAQQQLSPGVPAAPSQPVK